MVNTDDFIKRLEILLDYYSLSASVFADKMGVQRSGLSHLMSGRNKPSLDFVMKIVENFPEVDMYWLLNGDGTFPKKENVRKQIPEPILPSPSPQKNENAAIDLFSIEESNSIIEDVLPEKKTAIKSSENSNIERIVIFYTDGTFKSYNPEN